MGEIIYYKNLSLENIRYTDEQGNHCIEQWKPIEGYEGLYEVSDIGRVKSLARLANSEYFVSYNIKEKILRQSITAKYLGVSLVDKINKKSTKRVHLLVAIAFIPNPNKKRTVNHKNGIKIDNRACQLEWNTYSENNRHSIQKLGKKFAKGFDALTSKRVLCKNNGVIYGSVREASRLLHFPKTNILEVCHGKREFTKGYSFEFITNGNS